GVRPDDQHGMVGVLTATDGAGTDSRFPASVLVAVELRRHPAGVAVLVTPDREDPVRNRDRIGSASAVSGVTLRVVHRPQLGVRLSGVVELVAAIRLAPARNALRWLLRGWNTLPGTLYRRRSLPWLSGLLRRLFGLLPRLPFDPGLARWRWRRRQGRARGCGGGCRRGRQGCGRRNVRSGVISLFGRDRPRDHHTSREGDSTQRQSAQEPISGDQALGLLAVPSPRNPGDHLGFSHDPPSWSLLEADVDVVVVVSGLSAPVFHRLPARTVVDPLLPDHVFHLQDVLVPKGEVRDLVAGLAVNHEVKGQTLRVVRLPSTIGL